MSKAANQRFHDTLLALLNGLMQRRENDPTYKILSPQEMLSIQVLGNQGPVNMSELARQSGMLANTMTGVVDRMVRRRIVIRESSPNDRRYVLVRLTDYGKKLHRQQEQFTLAAITDLLENLDAKEQTLLVELLEKVTLPLQN